MARTLRDTPEDLKLVSAHVAQLPRRSAPRTIDASPIRGEVTYQTCAACHGADGMGNQVLNAPPIAGSSDWYLLTQLKNFKAGIRGGNPAVDINGATMMGIATTLDEQSMLDVISYINLLGDTGAAK
jgi:cytochrome c553